MKYSNIDSFISTSFDFWRDLEGYCLPECCGIDAYNFEPEYVNEVIQRHNMSNVLKSLIELNEYLDSNSINNIQSEILNHVEETNIFKNRVLKLINQLNKSSLK